MELLNSQNDMKINSKTIRRINFFAGPGAGKSTVASYLFSQLKIANYLVEFVPEYIKKWAWQKRVAESWSQVYVFGKQLYSEYSVLETNNEVTLICECPVMMNVAYCSIQHCNCMEQLHEIALKFEQSYPSCNIFLDRYSGPYQQEGRYQSYKEALEVDSQLLAFLHNTLIPFVRIPSDNFDRIVEHVVSAMVATS